MGPPRGTHLTPDLDELLREIDEDPTGDLLGLSSTLCYKMAQQGEQSLHLSLRLGRDLHERLTRAARGRPESRSRLAARLIEEGLRMEAHPGIVFRGGPGGRRPGLVGGPDVWEIARVLRDTPGTDEKRIRRTAELTDLPVHMVRAAARYYREFGDEIDRWIEAVDREAEESEGRLPAIRR